jgi:pyruvate kinase
MNRDNFRRTKIIFTIGPASDSEEALEKIIRAGGDICRINMAHASHDYVRTVIRRVRAVGERIGRDIAIMMDVKGPEIRTGDVDSPIILKPGEIFDFTVRPSSEGDGPRHSPEEVRSVGVNYRDLVKDIHIGDTVLVDNGLIRLEVLSKDDLRIRCRVLIPGQLTSRRHINLPGVKVNLPALTEKDKNDLAVGLAEGIDFVALSFVREKADILMLRDYLERSDAKARIIAKIEDQHAVTNLEEIILASDGLMVARGDLGIECPIEELPVIQRRAVRIALNRGRPVIIATHMLESMISSPVPTRAEVTDVANAVFELADAVMLSGESTVGKYPVECVETLSRIARRIEAVQEPTLQRNLELGTDKGRILEAAAVLAGEIKDACILVFTRYGFMAHGLSSLRPNRSPIYAFTNSAAVARQLRILWGVEPFQIPFVSDPEQTIRNAMRLLLEEKIVRTGDKLVVVSDIIARDRLIDSIQLRIVE